VSQDNAASDAARAAILVNHLISMAAVVDARPWPQMRGLADAALVPARHL
jgi:hypothetical protein